MLRNLIENFLSRSKGTNCTIDSRIDTTELLALVLRQSISLTRGLALRRALIFLEGSVTIRSPKRVTIGRFSKIGSHSLIEGLSRDGVVIGSGVSLGRWGRVRATATLSELGVGAQIGNFVGMGDFFYLGAFGGIVIGDETIIGERFTVHSDNHNFADPNTSIRMQGTTALPVRIGARCWIGSNVSVLGGVEIGNDSVVGAGAVVTKSFPPGSILVGNPARAVRNRFQVEGQER